MTQSTIEMDCEMLVCQHLSVGVSVDCNRDMTDYDEVFSDDLCKTDVPTVVSDPTSLCPCDATPVSELNFVQKTLLTPDVSREHDH